MGFAIVSSPQPVVLRQFLTLSLVLPSIPTAQATTSQVAGLATAATCPRYTLNSSTTTYPGPKPHPALAPPPPPSCLPLARSSRNFFSSAAIKMPCDNGDDVQRARQEKQDQQQQAAPACQLPKAGESSGSQAASSAVQPELPPLSSQDFKIYNSLAEKMDCFHNHFRETWNMLYTAASTNKRPRNITLKQFIESGLSFVQFLTTHHSIEETHLFPILARKMPEFQKNSPSGGESGTGGAAELIRQHREIHRGMDEFEAYLRRCRKGEADLEMCVLKEMMDSWGGVLWRHLDQEVETLGADNMRRYWTIEEMRSFPI